jgi:hypothetical protein
MTIHDNFHSTRSQRPTCPLSARKASVRYDPAMRQVIGRRLLDVDVG